MYNMERYCTSLYCIENPYWTRRRIKSLVVRIVLKTRIGLRRLVQYGFSIITLAWTISVYDADADLLEDTYKNIYKFWVDRTMNK